jgi:hypothetical protein
MKGETFHDEEYIILEQGFYGSQLVLNQLDLKS